MTDAKELWTPGAQGPVGKKKKKKKKKGVIIVAGVTNPDLQEEEGCFSTWEEGRELACRWISPW